MDEMEDIDVNAAIWGMFMSTTLRAAVHLGQHYDQNLRFANDHLKDLNRNDGESMEFEWKIFPGFTTFGLLQEIPIFLQDRQCEPEQFEGNIIFMSMFNDIILGEKERKCREM